MSETKKITQEDLKKAMSEEIAAFLKKHQDAIVKSAHERLRKIKEKEGQTK